MAKMDEMMQQLFGAALGGEGDGKAEDGNPPLPDIRKMFEMFGSMGVDGN